MRMTSTQSQPGSPELLSWWSRGGILRIGFWNAPNKHAAESIWIAGWSGPKRLDRVWRTLSAKCNDYLALIEVGDLCVAVANFGEDLGSVFATLGCG